MLACASIQYARVSARRACPKYLPAVEWSMAPAITASGNSAYVAPDEPALNQ
ncbi:hypothetical protein HNQ92_002256 [Rhabdobacter roseus]|uniref:Uncharacterized protein n=1 Tax=Rhabdobacter roseus TaxID=1655419 RepID=A0A840TS75_9BACT|nr:hypothetical protein [Rhabdobacter roseus]MBB5284113.1 hypothetical protein [Rhabdobacter roseus]